MHQFFFIRQSGLFRICIRIKGPLVETSLLEGQNVQGGLRDPQIEGCVCFLLSFRVRIHQEANLSRRGFLK